MTRATKAIQGFAAALVFIATAAGLQPWWVAVAPLAAVVALPFIIIGAHLVLLAALAVILPVAMLYDGLTGR